MNSNAWSDVARLAKKGGAFSSSSGADDGGVHEKKGRKWGIGGGVTT